MEIFCEYSYDPCEARRVFYTCFVNEQNIPEDAVLKFTGQHNYGNTNNDVAEVNFSNCNVTKVPQGLTRIFPNMKSLSICGSNLKDLKKIDLIEYKNLEFFGFANNCIEILPGDLFEGFVYLSEISFVGNKLRVIVPNILDGLNNLKLVDFSNNPNYTKLYSEDPETLGNGTLQNVKAELREKYCNNSEIVINANQKYEDEIRALKIAVQNLTQENQALRNSEAGLQQQFLALNVHDVQKGIHSDIENYLQDDNFKDFQIIIDEQKFNVHKFLLAARSPTLAEIFLNNPHAESLNLVEISVNIFEKILKFLYTDELPELEDGKYLHLFSTADRLKIEELKDFSAEKILEGMNGDNALEILGFGNKYAHRMLRLKAFEELKKTYPRIEFFDDWAFQPERVVQVIELFKQKEDALKKMEEKFKDMKTNN